MGGLRTCSERNSAGDCPAVCKAANAPGVATSLPRGNSGRRSIAYFMEAPFEGFVFCFLGTAQSGAEKANSLPGGRTAPSRSRRQGRAVCVHWSEAKALTEEAHGLGAGFCQEGKRREEKGRQRGE